MTKIRSRLTGRGILVSFENPADRALFVEVEVDCPSCGTFTLRIPGHHLRALRNLCLEMIDLHPDLTGEESGIEVLNRMSFSGRPNRPEEN